MDSQNYPKGENHIQTVRREDISLQNIKNLVNNQYGMEKRLEYNDSRNDKIMINNQEALGYAVNDSAKQYYEEYIRSLQLLGKTLPSPFVIPQVEVKFIVSTMPSGSLHSNFGGTYLDLSGQFIHQKGIMLRELATTTGISINELEVIYMEFCRVSRGRKTDGRIGKSEFIEIMSSKMTNFVLIEDLFNALDEYHTGVVDFRNFVAALGVLRGGFIENKLLLAFNAYCKSDLNSMAKSDLFALAASNNSGKVYQDINQLVSIVFLYFDTDHDGKLSFQEFSNACNSNYIKLDPFWTGYTLISFEELMIPCIQCAKKISARGTNGLPGKCESCERFSPGKRPFLYS